MSNWVLILILSTLLIACGSDNKSPPDSDGDGVIDKTDVFPNDATETADADGDGVGDNADAFPNDDSESIDTDGDGVGENSDAFPNDDSESIDTDGDGVGDNSDAFPNDSSETLDSDLDGVGDHGDVFPNNIAETKDTDGDGVGDNGDAFPNDATETLDTDGDDIGDNTDLYPLNSQESQDSDSDGVGDNRDAFDQDPEENTDSDGDGVGNNRDNCFLIENPEQRDTNNDGLGDACSSNDTGILYSIESDVQDAAACSEFVPDIDHDFDNIIETQDCSIGRDAEYLADQAGFNAAKTGSGIAGFDFSKIDVDGNILDVTTANWACIRDNVTGLMWEKKSDDAASIHYKLHAYSWYSSESGAAESSNSNEPNMKLAAYDTFPVELRSCDGVYDAASSSTFCNTEAYLQRVNSTYAAGGGLCGNNNWRLPTINELSDIANFGFDPDVDPIPDPAPLGIDVDFFSVAHIAYSTDRQKNFTGEYFSSSTRGEENQPLATQQLKWVQSFIDPHSRLLKQANIGGHIMLVAEPE